MVRLVLRSVRFLLMFCLCTLSVFLRRIFKGPKNKWAVPMELVMEMAQRRRDDVVDYVRLRSKLDKCPPLTSRSVRRRCFSIEHTSGTPLTKYTGQFVSKEEKVKMHAEWLIPKKYDEKSDKEKRVIMYIHGGGFVICSSATHRMGASFIAEASNIPLLLFDYRLAPENRYPSQLHDCLAVYRWLQSEEGGSYLPSQIIFCGDSAGGNLCLSLSLWLKQQSLPLPKALILMSPWTDISNSSDSWERNFHNDYLPQLNVVQLWPKHYLPPDMSPHDPRVSPVNADLTDFPPILIQVSDCEQLYDDSKRLEDNAKRCGVHVELQTFSHVPHVFQLFGPILMPISKLAYGTIANFIERQYTREIFIQSK